MANPTLTFCHLSIDPPADGPRNMAVDERLLNRAAESAECQLRIYRWAPPTLSLGYFQQAADRSEHRASLAVPAVRRLSGGGAILHDGEITYSLAVPAGHRLAASRDRLYQLVHRALVETLGELGIAGALWPADRPGPQPEPFMCFSRRAPGDVVVGTAKVAGSAQRRRRGAVLQHGSVLLRRSTAAPEFPGLEDLVGRRLDEKDLVDRWLARLAGKLGFEWQQGTRG